MTNNSKDIDARSWEGPEGHRFALEVLQLPLRRKILKSIASEAKEKDEIGQELGLSSSLLKYHLEMLEKALVIERRDDGWRATATGRLYLDKVEAGL